MNETNNSKNIEKLEKKVEQTVQKVDIATEIIKEQKVENKELKKEISKLKRIENKARTSALIFKDQFNKSLFTAIVTASGLILAFSWQAVISELISKFLPTTPYQSKLLQAIIVTFIVVIVILIFSRFQKKEN